MTLRESIKRLFKESKNLYYVVKDTIVTDQIFANDPAEAKEIALSHNPNKFDSKQIMDPYEYDDRFGDGTLKDRKYAVKDGKAIEMAVADTKDEAANEFTSKVDNYDEILTFDEFVSKYQSNPEEDMADQYQDSFLDDPSLDLWDPGMP